MDLLEAARQGNGPSRWPPHMLLPLVASTCATRFMIDFQLGHFSRRFSQELLNRAANAGNLPERLRFCAYSLPVLVPSLLSRRLRRLKTNPMRHGTPAYPWSKKLIPNTLWVRL